MAKGAVGQGCLVVQEGDGVVGGGVAQRHFVNEVGGVEERGEMKQGLVFDGLAGSERVVEDYDVGVCHSFKMLFMVINK